MSAKDGGPAWEHIATAAEMSEAHPAPWLVDGLLRAGQATVLGGESKIGKSWLAIDLAVAVASGTPWLGRATAQRPVLYVAAEGGGSWVDRARGFARARGIGDLASLELAVLRGRGAAINLLERGGEAALREAIEAIGAGLVILDPLALLHQGDEDSATEMGRVLAAARRCLAPGPTVGRWPAAAVIVHHLRKPGPNGSGGRLAHRLRGSGALHAWADGLWYYRPIADRLRLDVEARDYQAPEPLWISREVEGEGPTAKVTGHCEAAAPVRAKAKADKVDVQAEPVTPSTDYSAVVLEALRLSGPATRKSLAVGHNKNHILAAVRDLLARGEVHEVGGRIVAGPAVVEAA